MNADSIGPKHVPCMACTNVAHAGNMEVCIEAARPVKKDLDPLKKRVAGCRTINQTVNLR